MAHVKQIFLSTVTREFKGYRDELRGQLTRFNVSVAVQRWAIARRRLARNFRRCWRNME